MEYTFQQESNTKYTLTLQKGDNVRLFRFNTSQEIEHPDEVLEDKILSGQQHQAIIDSFTSEEKLLEFINLVLVNPNTGYSEYLNSL